MASTNDFLHNLLAALTPYYGIGGVFAIGWGLKEITFYDEYVTGTGGYTKGPSRVDEEASSGATAKTVAWSAAVGKPTIGTTTWISDDISQQVFTAKSICIRFVKYVGSTPVTGCMAFTNLNSVSLNNAGTQKVVFRITFRRRNQ